MPRGTCLDVVRLPPLPAARAVVAGRLPQRQNPPRSFTAANVRNRSSAEHPPPPSRRPHPRSPTPGGGDLGHPGRSRGPKGGCYPAGSPGAIGGGWGRWRPVPGSWVPRWDPPTRRPASLPAPAARAPAGAGAPLTPPRRAGARAGCARYIRLEAPLGPSGPSLSGGRRGREVVSVAAKLSGASGSSCSSAPEPSLPPSLLSLGPFFRVNYVSH